MNILAIDTATESCSAALLVDASVSVREKRLERGHAAEILFMVDELLRAAGITLASVRAIAFGRGPGAFTGVRLAASVAQGLAFGAGLPVVPVSDLQALAQRALEEQPEAERVLACTDARMREVYWGCFTRSGEGLAVSASEERVSAPGEVHLPEAWTAREGQRQVGVCGAGAGFALYPELRSVIAPAAALDTLLPRAREVARLAVAEVEQGRVLPPEEALPVYLRNEVTHKPSISH